MPIGRASADVRRRHNTGIYGDVDSGRCPVHRLRVADVVLSEDAQEGAPRTDCVHCHSEALSDQLCSEPLRVLRITVAGHMFIVAPPAPKCRSGVRHHGHHEHVRVAAVVTLWKSERAFNLPGTGTRSMLFRFGEDRLFGAVATSLAGAAFAPGTEHEADLEIWAEGADGVVVEGAEFVVWYGGDVGTGKVAAIL